MKKLLLILFSNDAYLKAIGHTPGAPILILIFILASCTKTETNIQKTEDYLHGRGTEAKFSSYDNARRGTPNPCGGRGKKPCPTTPPPDNPPTTPPADYTTVYLNYTGYTDTTGGYWSHYGTSFAGPTVQLDTALIRQRIEQLYPSVRLRYVYTLGEFQASNRVRRQMVVFTSSATVPGSGWAYMETMFWGLDVPVLVNTSNIFNYAIKIAETAAHEIGHSLGLYHSKEYGINCEVLNNYKSGYIMGNLFYNSDPIWNPGEQCLAVNGVYNRSEYSLVEERIGLK